MTEATTTNHLGNKRSSDDLRFLPQHTVDRIIKLASMGDYTHGIGCGCYNEDRCNVGEPIYRKIAAEVGTNHHTVHGILDPEYKKQLHKASKQYRDSALGKATIAARRDKQRKSDKRYRQTEKGKAARKRATVNFRKKSQPGTVS